MLLFVTIMKWAKLVAGAVLVISHLIGKVAPTLEPYIQYPTSWLVMKCEQECMGLVNYLLKLKSTPHISYCITLQYECANYG